MLEATKMAEAVFDAVRGFVTKSVVSLIGRMDALEGAIKAIPAGAKGDQGDPGQDGAPGPQGDRGETGETGMVGPKGEPGERGQDGVPGPQGDPGAQGEKGIDGRDGRDGLPGLTGEKGIDGTNGRDGIDGKDGFGLEDFDIALADDGRTLSLKFARGEVVIERSIKLATILDRGVYRPENEYEKGDGVTYGGSFWIAQGEVKSVPGTGEGWRLAVKRGRDGADGKSGERGERGLPGERGRDLTQMGLDGAKW